MLNWLRIKIQQPSTYAGIATVCTAIAAHGTLTGALPIVLAGIGSILANA